VVDLGAAWVHDPVGNPLAEALAAAEIPTSNDGAYHSRMAAWADGWVGAPEVTALAAAVEADWDASEALAALGGSDRFLDGVEWFLDDRGLEGRSRDLARFGLVWVWGAMLFAAPPDRISLAGAAAYAWGSGGNLVPAGGYRALVDRLAAGLIVHLETAVTAIDHDGAGAVVRSNGGTFEGDRVIVTVPLGVLKHGALAVEPPLREDQRDAVERLAMGTLEKVVLRFPERFWDESIRQITHLGDDHSFPDWIDFSRHTGAPTLVAFHNPRVSPSLADLSSEDRIAVALDVLRQMFGDAPDPDQALATDWARDPWSLGSYSYIPIGATTGDMGRLAEPVSDRLLLAGEATVPEHHGSVHAAFESGLRAAGTALGRPPERLSLGAVPARWLGRTTWFSG
jgi:predicted NAD/FAD-dependent oxidoreductase